MNWPTVPIREIAPAQASNLCFSPDESVWHLTLDQIESNTGYIVGKKRAPAKEAGTSTYVFDNGNVLYSKLRPYLNKVICPTESGIATTELVPLRPCTDLLDRRYLTYYLRSNHFLGFANVAVAGVKMPRIIMAKFWEHRVPLPSLSEQRRIAEILDQAAALRKRRAEADAKAARILPALFYKMFGDPVSNLKAWPIRQFHEIADSRLGKMLDAKQQTGEHCRPYLRNANVQWDRLDLREVFEMDFDHDDRQEFRLRKGDLLICEGGEVGRCAIWDEELPECYFQKALHRVRPKERESTSEYLLYLSMSLASRGALRESTSQVTIAHLTGVKLKHMRIPVPPFELQKRFSTLVEDQKSAWLCLIKRCGHIDTLFNALLHRAFAGDLTAKWREAHMKELLAEMHLQSQYLDAMEANT